jgi:ubiquinone/menaquinone biosynthesis C-methylase UbiE
MKYYPISFDEAESERLDEQSSLLFDDSIVPLIKNAKTCLEVGCGVGSNLEIFRRLNPLLEYTGIASDKNVIHSAQNRFRSDKHSEFIEMDLRQLDFKEGRFDLVIARLVFWGIGKGWEKGLDEIHRVLKLGGIFYSFEPDDQYLLFHPPKRKIEELISLWQQNAKQKSLDPFIGRKMGFAMSLASFEKIQSKVYLKVSSSLEMEKYQRTMHNLKSLFLLKGLNLLKIKKESALFCDAQAEFNSCSPGDLVTEGYFVHTCIKKEKNRDRDRT